MPVTPGLPSPAAPAPPIRPPKLVAPAGGEAQFFAALNSGADSVYLGLRRFSARARAENFDLEQLASLLPLARRHGMEVLVTTNILVRQGELGELVELLAGLEELGVDALVVQDLGLARIARRSFPTLRLHASTQLAVHSPAGAREAARLGFSRVVLARELTVDEIDATAAAVADTGLELEVFCHGSLCTSYSGLCLFSSLLCGQSGNRGGCVYPCRRPFRVTGEEQPGDLLLSSRDLELQPGQLRTLLARGSVAALKIEGRKKDAQYVQTVVRLYRRRLDELWGRSTLRATAPALAHELQRQDAAASPAADLAFTFQRRTTTGYLDGRHPRPPVLDPTGATHQGVPAGTVQAVQGRWVQLRLERPLELHDGLRLDDPATGPAVESLAEPGDGVSHGSQLAVRRLGVAGRPVVQASAGQLVELELPPELPAPRVGMRVIQVRSADLRRRTERLTSPPPDSRRRPWPPLTVQLSVEPSRATTPGDDDERQLVLRLGWAGEPLLELARAAPPMGSDADRGGCEPSEIASIFSVFGDAGFSTRAVELQLGPAPPPLHRALLKQLKQQASVLLPGAAAEARRRRRSRALARLGSAVAERAAEAAVTPSRPGPHLTLALDRQETLAALVEAWPTLTDSTRPQAVTFVQRPGATDGAHADAGAPTPHVVALWQRLAELLGVAPLAVGSDPPAPTRLRLGLPAVVRAAEQPALRRSLLALAAAVPGPVGYELGGLASLALLRDWGLLSEDADLGTDHPLPLRNSETALHWAEQGVRRVCLSPEEDLAGLLALLQAWPAGAPTPVVLLHAALPLMISEACTLAALGRGCPGPARCGRRTLELAPSAHDESPGGKGRGLGPYQLVHEGCRASLYSTRPFAITEHGETLGRAGAGELRVDLVGRDYAAAEIRQLLVAAAGSLAVAGSWKAPAPG